jgi:hypothetical protein
MTVAMTKRLPNVAIVESHRTPPSLVPLLVGLRRWCQVFALTVDAPAAIDATVAVTPDADLPAGIPAAVWVESVDDMSMSAVAAAAVVLTRHDCVLEASGARGLFAAEGQAAVVGCPIGPFVRGRLRHVRHLPPHATVEFDGARWWWQGRSLDHDLVDTGLGCAIAAVVTGPDLLRALAWATPSVTDSATAAMLGARDGMEVLVGDSVEERRRLASSIAADPVLAARLSWAGRMLVERRHDSTLAAADLVRRLGLGSGSSLPGPANLAARMAELGTPPGAWIVERAVAATAPLTDG